MENERMEKRKLLGIKLRVEARDRHGRVVGVREKSGDLILDNFRDILATIFYPESTYVLGSRRNADVVDFGGAAVSVPVVSNVDLSSGEGHSMLGAWVTEFIVGVLIHIGTDTTPPTRGDYKLGAEVERGAPTITVGADYISWAVSIVLEAAKTIAEAGMTLRLNYAFSATLVGTRVFVFRDTFTPIDVPAGGTISVTYTLTL